MTQPEYIDVPCAVCGKMKRLKIVGRTCSTECYTEHRRIQNNEYHRQYYRRKREKEKANKAEGVSASAQRASE